MKTHVTPSLLVAAIVIVTASLFQTACSSPAPADVSQIEEIHLRMDPADIDDLMSIIEGESEDYVRERAVLTLTDIAIRTGKAEGVIGFLKDLAYNEEGDQVRTAAYNAMDQIRQLYPLKVEAGLDLLIDSDIFQGATVSLVARCYCERDVDDASVGIRRIDAIGDSPQEGISVGSPSPVNFSLEGGEPNEITFDLVLSEAGRYDVVCTLDLGFDRVDYLTMEKTAQIRVEASGGAYEVSPSESTVPEDRGRLSSGWIALISVLAAIVVAGLGVMGFLLKRSMKRR